MYAQLQCILNASSSVLDYSSIKIHTSIRQFGLVIFEGVNAIFHVRKFCQKAGTCNSYILNGNYKITFSKHERM